MTIYERISAASSDNTRLLKILRETDYASSALSQNSLYISSLQQEISARQKEYGLLRHAKFMEQKDHEKYRDSTMRRLAYKMGGKKEKFEATAQKEEREYRKQLLRDQFPVVVQEIESCIGAQECSWNLFLQFC